MLSSGHNGASQSRTSPILTGKRQDIGRKYLGYSISKPDAMREPKPLAERMRESKKTLALKVYKHVITRQTKKGPRYHGHIWVQKKIRKRTCWTKKYFPRAKSPKEAAARVAEYLETTLGSIKVEKSSQESPARSADRMAFLCEMFRGWVPADLQNSVKFRGKASSLQAYGPAAYVAGLVGKEDRWRDAVLKIWEAMPSSERLRLQGMGSRDEALALDGARTLHAFLSLTVALWAGWSIPRLGSMSWPVDVKKEIAPPTSKQQALVEKHRRWWNQHVHRNVLHHFSPGVLAQQLGIVRKTTRRAGSLLIGTDGGEYYGLVPFNVAQAKALQALHTMGVVLNSLPVPRNNREWAQAQAAAITLADTMKINRSEYRWPWLVRAYLFAEMRHHGVRRLNIVEDWTLTQLQEALQPDQNKWLTGLL